MAKQWGIKIVKLPNGTVAFQPDVPGAKPGQPLGVNEGDIVRWNNRTDQAHWPVAIAPPGFLTKDIPAGQVSDPFFQIPSGAMSITYRCLHHPQEHGAIVVVSQIVS